MTGGARQATTLESVHKDLAKATRALRFSAPVAHVYRPLEYAADFVAGYLARFGQGKKEVLLLGMNPGPFGMGQTGIPFGDVPTVRDYLGLTGEIRPPKNVHAKRPVMGLLCPRVEVSGQRLWGAIAKRHPSPATFFKRAFVLNYCPLLFLDERGANVTPDKIARPERAAMEAVCDEALSKAVVVLGAKHLVGVGLYAKKRLEAVAPPGAVVSQIPHPSPASPLANRGWEPLASQALEDAGIRGLF